MSKVSQRQAALVAPSSIKYSAESRPVIQHRGIIERKMERFFRESEELGWDYDAFVASVLEILTVLHHRNQLR
jgi:hypothetical protein